MRPEQTIFNKALNRVNFFLKLTGLDIKDDDELRSLSQRLSHRWFFCLNVFWMNTDSFSWFGITHKLSVQEITYMIPCIILCFLGDFKSYYFIKWHHHVVDLIRTLKNLQAIKVTGEEVEVEMRKKRLPFLYLANNVLLMMCSSGIAMFFIGPTVIAVTHYLKTGEIQLVLPFMVWYPFDAYNIKYWPFAMSHQFWSAWVTVFFVYGPDCFYYTCCAFIHLQFRSLNLAMRQVARKIREEGRQEFIALVHWHRELVRCIELLDIIYGKSTLFNAISSSVTICVTGFNILAIDDLLVMAPFTPFLSQGALQIFLFCYYGDLLMRDSVDISEAVYDSEWYDLDASDMKYCLFMIIRAQKPCKITAYGFKDINLTGFTTILSSAWSYFTLLMTMYGNRNQLHETPNRF